MRIIISNILVLIGMAFFLFGTAGLIRFKNVYIRSLLTSNADTVGFITVLFGVMVQHGFSFFSAKILLILIVSLTVNPLAAGSIIKSANQSGLRLEDPND